MWLRDTQSTSRAMVVNKQEGLIVDTDAIDGSVRLLGVDASSIGLEELREKADVELLPVVFRESQSSDTHYLRAEIVRVVDTKPPTDPTPKNSDESSSTETTNQHQETVPLADVTRNTAYATVEGWVNVVSVFGPDYIQQKVWLGDTSLDEYEFPLVINKKYSGKLVRSEHKYRFRNVQGNYNGKQKEVQLIANHRTKIEHIRAKSDTSKPKWRDP